MASPSGVLCRCYSNLRLFAGFSYRRALFSTTCHTGDSMPAANVEFKIPPPFQSESSLRPNSNQKAPSEQNNSKKLPQFSGFVPVERLDIRYSRASGPGGQHVNRTNSKVEVRFNVQKANWLPDWIRQRLLVREASRLTGDGFIIVSSDKTRKQMLNQADCIDKIRRMVVEASRLPKEPTPEEIALRERRLKQANFHRLADRKHHSQIKQGRQAPSATDAF